MANPHLELAAVLEGAQPANCRVAVVAVHGRDQSAGYMVEHVVRRLEVPGVAWVLPQAHGGSWYPLGFLAPLADNQPRLDQAFEVLDRVRDDLAARAVPPERTVWLGFSQGACVATEWVSRHPMRWGGLISFTGGRIGAPEEVRPLEGAFEGMPAYFGVASHDGWVPVERVQDSAAQFVAAGAQVTLEVFAGDGHEIRGPEIEAARRIISAAAG